MTDDLDPFFEDRPEPERWRHARRRGRGGDRGGRRKTRRGRTFFALTMSLVLLAVLGGGAWYGYGKVRDFFVPPDYTTAGTGEVQVEIKKLDTITDIGNTLYRADVVKSAKAFVNAADENPKGDSIQPGFYKLRTKMRASYALEMLLDLKNKVVSKVTIPEGKTYLQTFDLLSKATGIPVDEFAAAAKDPQELGVPDFWFKRSDGKKVTKSIEGFLYPATYELDPDTTAEKILRTMVGQFLTVAEEISFVETVEQERGGITPYEALMVASFAQAEAGTAEDIPKVARVAYNRLYKKWSELGNRNALEFDVTTNYGLQLRGKQAKESKNLTMAELNDPKNAYSTHAHQGLPPTAINSPGKVALQGAADPPSGNWLFFVAIDKQGHSAFATTLAEHERNKQKAEENGVL